MKQIEKILRFDNDNNNISNPNRPFSLMLGSKVAENNLLFLQVPKMSSNSFVDLHLLAFERILSLLELRELGVVSCVCKRAEERVRNATVMWSTRRSTMLPIAIVEGCFYFTLIFYKILHYYYHIVVFAICKSMSFLSSGFEHPQKIAHPQRAHTDTHQRE